MGRGVENEEACNSIALESRILVLPCQSNLITIRPGISHGEWLLNPDEEVDGSAAYGLSQ